MRNSHLEKIDRNQKIRELLADGWTQAKIAEEFNISIQRVNNLIQKWLWRGLLERNRDGFVMPKEKVGR